MEKSDSKAIASLLDSNLNITNSQILVYSECGSTNDLAKSGLAQTGNGSGLPKVYIASRQTQGRGRNRRPFASPEGGIYMSIAFKCPNPVDALVTIGAAAAVAESIAKVCGQEAKIKWVNDILVGGKKVCGILAEGVLGANSGELEYAVVGIGINYDTPWESFPEDVRGKAASLFAPGQNAQLKIPLIANIINILLGSNEQVLERYKGRLDTLGKRVLVNGQYYANAVGLGETGELVVELGDGSRITLAYGEASIIAI
ncbi:MAG: biotin--[acetyl-CoA-carboxylase] ligase [Eubacteriaceae bacterium]|nr:biotin--[acetyl-CoA-carboxylase] ligase [Eubacteriaceae bacterium]